MKGDVDADAAKEAPEKEAGISTFDD